MFCAASALVISWQHINHLTFLARDVYRFHLYFYVRMILHHLCISSPHEDGFSKAKSVYYSICDDYSVNWAETKMNRNCFYTTKYHIFSDRGKDTKSSLLDNLLQWIITTSTGFALKGIEKISRSVRAYVHLLLINLLSFIEDA